MRGRNLRLWCIFLYMSDAYVYFLLLFRRVIEVHKVRKDHLVRPEDRVFPEAPGVLDHRETEGLR